MTEIEILKLKKTSNAKGGTGKIISDSMIITKAGAASAFEFMAESHLPTFMC